MTPQHCFYLTTNVQEICTLTVHFVNETNTWYVIVICKSPVRFRLWLNTINSTKQENQTIKYTQRTVYLYGKINVSCSIDNVNVILITTVVPEYCCSSRSNGNTTLLLLLHPVHGSCTIVNLTNFVTYPCVVKDTLGSRCLTRIDVGSDTNVSCVS